MELTSEAVDVLMNEIVKENEGPAVVAEVLVRSSCARGLFKELIQKAKRHSEKGECSPDEGMTTALLFAMAMGIRVGERMTKNVSTSAN